MCSLETAAGQLAGMPTGTRTSFGNGNAIKGPCGYKDSTKCICYINIQYTKRSPVPAGKKSVRSPVGRGNNTQPLHMIPTHPPICIPSPRLSYGRKTHSGSVWQTLCIIHHQALSRSEDVF
eukprot:scaffold35683_cov24-Prasinocladus_malaysianus.AAC.1